MATTPRAARFAANLPALRRYAYFMYGSHSVGDSLLQVGWEFFESDIDSIPGDLSDFGLMVRCLHEAAARQADEFAEPPEGPTCLPNAILQLPVFWRSALLLTVVEGLDDNEVARTLGCSVRHLRFVVNNAVDRVEYRDGDRCERISAKVS